MEYPYILWRSADFAAAADIRHIVVGVDKVAAGAAPAGTAPVAAGAVAPPGQERRPAATPAAPAALAAAAAPPESERRYAASPAVVETGPKRDSAVAAAWFDAGAVGRPGTGHSAAAAAVGAAAAAGPAAAV